MPYYNTSLPTPSTKNNITDIAVSYGIRDFLLNKNLLPSYPILSTSLNGSPKIGEPVLDTSINGNANVTPFGLPLQTEGLLRYDIATLPNKFKDKNPSAPQLLNVTDVNVTQGPFGNADFPQGISSYPTSSNLDVLNYGLMGKTYVAEFRKTATLKNLYLNPDNQVDSADWVSSQPAGFSKQINGYLDTYGGLNFGGSNGVQASSIIGNVLNGQGLGLAKGGVGNFNLRSSLAGRVLGATGLMDDTKLGLIGGQQLALSLANNAAFNVEQAILGKINLEDNILALVKGGPLPGFRPNYKITVPSSILGKVADYTSRILGFTLPKSYLDDSGSIFLSESNSSNIERANAMLENTGKGQFKSLIANVNTNLIGTGQFDNPDSTPFRSGYAPGYARGSNKESAINPKIYAFYNPDGGTVYNFLISTSGVIPEISYNRSGMLSQYGFPSPEETNGGRNPYSESTIKTPTFTWGSDNGEALNSESSPAGGNIVQTFVSDDKKKSLLAKTQELFNDSGMKNIVSGFGDINPTIVPNQLQTAVVGGGISKGNAVMSSDKFFPNGRYTGDLDTPANTYCRVWTTNFRYDAVSSLVRKRGLDATYPYRNQMNGSVLDQYGFAKIAPYSTDSIEDPKKFMLSIENLAWFDNVENLIPCEQGPGDLISGKKGRIMWFPPYNIQFSESSSVSWESTNFIGRGEPVYTYSNTERGGNLSFQIIVDHPSYINAFRGNDGPDDHYVASYFAGCVEPSQYFVDKLTVSEISSLTYENVTKPVEKVVPEQTAPASFEVYYPNDNDSVPADYENGKCGTTPIDYTTYVSGCSIGLYPGTFTSAGKTEWFDRYNWALNGENNEIIIDNVAYKGIHDGNLIGALNTYLSTKCTACVVEIKGFASKQGKSSVNNELANARAESLKKTLYAQLFSDLPPDEKEKRFKVLNGGEIEKPGCVKNGPTDSSACKKDRKAVVSFRVDNNLLPKEDIKPDPVVSVNTRRINTKITNRFYSECSYFEQLTDSDPFVFDKFRDKIKYFHPAFHSTTPEGLNSRLTFLQQCTRQGPTLEKQGANNLAFGRPPICILRIGDFYNTKIVIDNLSIDYEPLVWDLNPEGVGVQPMIANVTLSFKFIGGSTLMGPINKLQNALSFNYYANTQVYDPRADYISKTGDNYNIVDGLKGKMEPKTEITSNEIIANTPVVDQEEASLENAATEELSEGPGFEEPELIGFDYDKNLSTKDDSGWKLKIRLKVKNPSGDWNKDAIKLTDPSVYALTITEMKGFEYYQIALNSNLIMEEFITPTNNRNIFNVPLKGYNGRTDGITDSFGKEKFYITLTKNNVKVQQTVIKLK